MTPADEGRETAPRPGRTDPDEVKEYVDETDRDVPEERREVRAGETGEHHRPPAQGDAPPDPGA